MAHKAKAVKIDQDCERKNLTTRSNPTALPVKTAVVKAKPSSSPRQSSGSSRHAPINSSVRKTPHPKPIAKPAHTVNKIDKSAGAIVFTDERSLAEAQPIDYIPTKRTTDTQPAELAAPSCATNPEKTAAPDKLKDCKRKPQLQPESAPIALPASTQSGCPPAVAQPVPTPDDAVLSPCSSYFDAPHSNECTYALRQSEIISDGPIKRNEEKHRRQRAKAQSAASLDIKKEKVREELRPSQKKAKRKPRSAKVTETPPEGAECICDEAASRRVIGFTADSACDSAAAASTTSESAAISVTATESPQASSTKADKTEKPSRRQRKEAVRTSAVSEDTALVKDTDTRLQGWRQLSLTRKLVMFLSLLLIIFSLFPLYVGIFSVGMIPPLCIALFCFTVAWLWNKISAPKKWYINLLYSLAALCICVGVALMSFISGQMISASLHTPPADSDEVTVIVLGCKIKGDRPSLMLQDRLDTAAPYLIEHPGAYCVVTGGQGEDEDYPESVVMRQYLSDKGISDRRIIAETTSTSTKENINNAAAMAAGCNLYNKAVIVSDRFHQFRARRLAQEAGFDYVYALNVETRWYLAMPYWFREMACIIRDWAVERS